MFNLKYKILIFSFLVVDVFADLRIDPLVDTKLGLIRGLRADDGDYSMFLGIPYAKVREDNPFANAVVQEPFEDVFEAYNDSPGCPQGFGEMLTGSLDCLHLNIYVPNSASSKNRLPVMIWIHGGKFSVGSNSRAEFGPKYLVRHDIILVTINYRLGPYGFMCVDVPDILGNQGLKDQLLAFRWINDNIGAFGGDTNKITISGESAGGMSVDLHLLSPYEKLYTSAIMQSGTSFVQTYTAPVKNAPIMIAGYLGHETDDINDAISFLSKADTNSVLSASNELGFEFKPCIEQEFDNVERFLPENWINVPLPKVKNLPILIGFNSRESLDVFGVDNAVFHESQIEEYLRIGFDVDNDAFDGMEEIVRHFYIGDKPISENVKTEMVEFLSDYKFNHPTIRTIKKYLDNGAGNIFSYMFSYSGERNILKTSNNITYEGANHADDLGYLFDPSMFSETPSASDQLVIDRMTTMWANFIKYSDPTPELTDVLTTKWTPITPGSQHYYLEIDAELSSKTRPYSNRMAFWDLFYKMNYNLQRIAGDNIVK